jgi:Domain of unknown function (DUF4386)
VSQEARHLQGSATEQSDGRSSAYRKTAILVGVLFLSSTVTFVAGSRLITTYFSVDRPRSSTLLAGVLLEGYTGLAVAGIGIAMLGILSSQSVRLARAYLALRVLECLAIATVGIAMVVTAREVPNYEALIYSFTAVGGIVFAYLLYTGRLVPRPLSGLGVIGYVVLLIGVLAALTDLTDLSDGWGTIFFVPGGLFELILPFVLFVKGFSIDPQRLRQARD